MNNIYANYDGCSFVAGGKLVCGGKWEKISGIALEPPVNRNYTYGIYGTQGDLQCGVDFKAYVKNTFNPQFAPLKRAPMDGPLTAVAPVESMPAKLLERFKNRSQPSPVSTPNR